jgi:hypothetical protein
MTPITRLSELKKRRDKILSMEGDKYLKHFRELSHIQQSINTLKCNRKEKRIDWGFKEVITRK